MEGETLWNLLHWWPKLIRHRRRRDPEIRPTYFVIPTCAHLDNHDNHGNIMITLITMITMMKTMITMKTMTITIKTIRPTILCWPIHPHVLDFINSSFWMNENFFISDGFWERLIYVVTWLFCRVCNKSDRTHLGWTGREATNPYQLKFAWKKYLVLFATCPLCSMCTQIVPQ